MRYGAVAATRGRASGPLVMRSRTVPGRATAPPPVEPVARTGDYWTLREAFIEACVGERLSPFTLRNYGTSLRLFGEWLAGRGHSCEVEVLTRSDVQGWLASRVQAGIAANTLITDIAALRRFFGWVAESPMVAEGWRNPAVGLKRPKVAVEPPAVLSLDQVRALIRECERGSRSPDRRVKFESLRDTAMARILFDVGPRRGELATMTVADAEAALATGRILGRFTVTGKTGTREVDISSKTKTALRFYLEVRKRHSWAGHAKVRDVRGQVLGEGLWLGQKGALSGDSIRRLLKARATAAGIEKWWTHLMRHTSVHHQLLSGAREHHVARLMGWHSTAMLERYAARQAVERALEEHRDLAIGDLL